MGQDYLAYTLKKDLPFAFLLTMPSKAGKESIFGKSYSVIKDLSAITSISPESLVQLVTSL